jgi:hypothetical protein
MWEAGPLLDAEIAKRVFGDTTEYGSVPQHQWNPVAGYWPHDDRRQCIRCKDWEGDSVACTIVPSPYSTYINAAWRVIENMRERGIWLAIRPVSEAAGALWHVSNHSEECIPYNGDWDMEFSSASAATAPLAICNAALMALGDAP